MFGTVMNRCDLDDEEVWSGKKKCLIFPGRDWNYAIPPLHSYESIGLECSTKESVGKMKHLG